MIATPLCVLVFRGLPRSATVSGLSSLQLCLLYVGASRSDLALKIQVGSQDVSDAVDPLDSRARARLPCGCVSAVAPANGSPIPAAPTSPLKSLTLMVASLCGSYSGVSFLLSFGNCSPLRWSTFAEVAPTADLKERCSADVGLAWEIKNTVDLLKHFS